MGIMSETLKGKVVVVLLVKVRRQFRIIYFIESDNEMSRSREQGPSGVEGGHPRGVGHEGTKKKEIKGDVGSE